MLLPGVMLLLAPRLSLGHASRLWLALCLALALVAHIVDLRRRWRG